MNIKKLPIALVISGLIGSAVVLEIHDKPASGLWLAIMLLIFFTDW